MIFKSLNYVDSMILFNTQDTAVYFMRSMLSHRSLLVEYLQGVVIIVG